MTWRWFYRFTLGCPLAIAVFVLSAIFCAPFINAFMAQNSSQSVLGTLKARIFPEEWRPFTSRKGRFRVLLPGGHATYSQKILESEVGDVKLHFYQVLRPAPISYTISYHDIPVLPRTAHLLEEYGENAISYTKGTKIQSRSLKFGKLDALENIVQMRSPRTNEIIFSRHRLILRGNRLYQLVVVTPTSTASRQESGRFMNSLEFLP